MSDKRNSKDQKKSTARVVIAILGSIGDTVLKVVIIAAAVIYILRGASAAYDYGFRIFTEEPVSIGEGRIITVQITTDDNWKSIGDMLEDKGLIRDAKVFYLQEILSEYHGKEVPGIYDLNTSMTAEEMLAVMSPKMEEDAPEAAVSPKAPEVSEPEIIPEPEEPDTEEMITEE